MSQSWKILFEDRHCLGVLKPARLLSGSDGSDSDTLYKFVRAYILQQAREGTSGYAAPIHFLDRPVSGVMIYAKSSKAAARLSSQFKNRQTQKTYLAVVEGTPSPRQARLRHFLKKDRATNLSKASLNPPPSNDPGDSKECLLDYEILQTRGSLSLLQVKPLTGRSHQIRAQLAAIHCPILGDKKYGSSQALSGMILLHAWKLTFAHPTTKQATTIAALPPDTWSPHWQNIESVLGSLN